MNVSIQTLVYIVNPLRQTLLGIKGRKLGAGKRMAPGGKFEPLRDRNIFKCGEIETLDETGVIVWNLEHRGVVTYSWEERPGHCNQVHILFTRHYRYDNGKGPITTDEMKDPLWFGVEALPAAEMWTSDMLWMPTLFRGEQVWFDVRYRGEETIRCEPVKPFDLSHLL